MKIIHYLILFSPSHSGIFIPFENTICKSLSELFDNVNGLGNAIDLLIPILGWLKLRFIYVHTNTKSSIRSTTRTYVVHALLTPVWSSPTQFVRTGRLRRSGVGSNQGWKLSIIRGLSQDSYASVGISKMHFHFNKISPQILMVQLAALDPGCARASGRGVSSVPPQSYLACYRAKDRLTD